jgi:hypothetical protein
MPQRATIVRPVEYREGDGPLLTIRPGPVEVSTSAQDAVLSWQDEHGEVRNNTAIPLVDFKRYVAEGAIQLEA